MAEERSWFVARVPLARNEGLTISSLKEEIARMFEEADEFASSNEEAAATAANELEREISLCVSTHKEQQKEIEAKVISGEEKPLAAFEMLRVLESTHTEKLVELRKELHELQEKAEQLSLMYVCSSILDRRELRGEKTVARSSLFLADHATIVSQEKKENGVKFALVADEGGRPAGVFYRRGNGDSAWYVVNLPGRFTTSKSSLVPLIAWANKGAFSSKQIEEKAREVAIEGYYMPKGKGTVKHLPAAEWEKERGKSKKK